MNVKQTTSRVYLSYLKYLWCKSKVAEKKIKSKLGCKVVITWSHFAGIKFQPLQPGQISLYDYMGKSIFIRQGGTGFHRVFAYKNL